MLNEAAGQAAMEPGAAGALRPVLERVRADGRLTVRLGGDWTTRTVASIDSEMRTLESEATGPVLLDLAAIRVMDTAGAWLVERLVTALDRRGLAVEVGGATAGMTTLLTAVSDAARLEHPARSKGAFGLTAFFATIGMLVYRFSEQFMMAMHILGATVRGAQLKFGRGHAISVTAIVHQMDRVGIGAIPIVMLMSGIVGAIIAQQGAFQMRYFGTEIFVVNLVSILVLREIGVLLTAIMVAGRSGSAITAELGSMKMREEVDALTVIGLNPVGVLVFPRLVALVITMPILTVAANAAALGGAILTAWFYSGIEPETFIQRMHTGIDLSTIFSGLIKAPFMGLIIGVIAAMEGMRVEGSAESLGRHVTASVVKAIFCVIVVDGLFAMFYAAIDY
ncbi:organic solvent ABC transporter permease [Zhengella mangrovi]|uniref:Organic solvent ABC transporter permease n=1 Tax=Zhengella mangrovi TaxID=1982044 RepID=A0A2G1QM72_9HYPH|nr:organic solvent ABC transporter permease [Zhengella mangrovi]